MIINNVFLCVLIIMLKSIIQKKCVVINVYIMFNNIPINNIVHKIINVFKINPKF